MTYQIEKGIAPPPDRACYPWDEMEVGDSFLVPDRRPQTVKNAAVSRAKHDGRRYATKIQPGGGIRVWRIE